MANVKITDLDALTTPATTDLLEIVDDVGGTPMSKKIAWQHLFATTLPLTSGQIAFPATAVPSADANTLDDYEEGTWTGELRGVTTRATTPVTVAGNYVKIGKQVSLQIFFSDVDTTGASGNMQIVNCPFTSAQLSVGSYAGYGLSVTLSPVVWIVGTELEFQYQANNSAWVDVAITAGANKYLAVTIVYFI